MNVVDAGHVYESEHFAGRMRLEASATLMIEMDVEPEVIQSISCEMSSRPALNKPNISTVRQSVYATYPNIVCWKMCMTLDDARS
jgi:hypothetical protein